MMKLAHASLLSTLVLLAAGCAQTPQQPAAAPLGLMDVMARPAERALLNGMRAYDDGHYGDAEKQLNAALQAGLASPKDKAAAHKHLAFVYCTSNRVRDCEAAFRAAKEADAAFALTRSEAGHPVWGPVYKRVQGQ
jgi:Tfp pilus assembly protein PilF